MKRFIYFFVFIAVFFMFSFNVFADMGPKPSIDIEVKNLKTTNYVLDLFIYDVDKDEYKSKLDYDGSGLSLKDAKKLYDLNFDGWVSESTRDYLLFSDCVGNSKHKHYFTYFDVPNEYKIVIINNDTGDIKISNKITRNEFESHVTIDYNSMIAIETGRQNINRVFIFLVLTILVELLVAFILRTKNYKIVTITNLITNLLLQVVLLLSTFFHLNNYMLMFICCEIVVIIVELIVYLLKFKSVSKLKVVLYTLIANAITIIISFLFY